VKTGLTTPDIVTFLSNMAGLRKMGIGHVAYEASSHGLDQYRSEGLPVVAAAFTNLSRDHLDYHGTMEAYFQAKMRLFDEVVGDGGSVVVWTADPRSEEVIGRARRRGLKVLTVGPGGETIDLKSQSPTPLGQTLLLGHGGQEWTLKLPLIGAYQAANVLVAAGLVLATGGSWQQTFAGLARLSPGSRAA
jgi:UDP-N-acetylmuramoyl-L-alanyl-D-glutamate--2,6-diaminopimelate ligase